MAGSPRVAEALKVDRLRRGEGFQELPKGGHNVGNIYDVLMYSGRLGRLGYLIGCAYLILPYALVTFGCGVLSQLIDDSGESDSIYRKFFIIICLIILFLFTILQICVSLSLVIRRWHDMDDTGWLVLLSFIPFVNIIAVAFLLFVPGTSGANQYGTPSTSYGLKAVLFGKGSSGVAPHTQPPDYNVSGPAIR